MHCSHNQRVPLIPESLHPNGAYILIDAPRKLVGAWAGDACRGVDRLLAETIASKILRDEFHKHTSVDSHIMSNPSSPGVPPPQLLSALSTTAEYCSKVISQLMMSEIIDDTNKLHAVELAENSTEPSVTLLEEQAPNGKTNNAGKLSYTNFSEEKILLFECGGIERFLWIGKRVPPKKAKIVKEAIKQTRGDFVYVREGLESILFKEKFRNVSDCFRSKFDADKTPQKGPTLQGIDGEVSRMVDENFGTLCMVGDPGGPVGDSTRPGLYMSLADEEDGELSVYCVAVHGNSRVLENTCTDVSLPVVLSSSRAYAIQYVCKNGSRAVMYLWVGNSCPADVQAALALRCKEVFPPNVSPDQIHVQQGREPPLLLRIVASRRPCPLCIVSSIGDTLPTSTLEKCFEVSITDVLLPTQSPMMIEVSTSRLPPLHSRNARVRVSVVTSSCDTAGTCSAESVTSSIEVGDNCAEATIEGARSIAANIVHILGVQEVDSSLHILHTSSRSRVNSVSSTSCDAAVAHIKYSAAVKVLVNEARSHSHKNRLSRNPDIVRPLRPVRLFQVSQSRRSVGAMFVEEIGICGTFTKEDLSAQDCYILDGGYNILYVWFGGECMYPAMALVTRVARRLLTALRDTVSSLADKDQDNGKPYEPNQLHLEEYFSVEADKELKMEYMKAYEEMVDFTYFFRDWYVSGPHVTEGGEASVPRIEKDVIFDPSNLPDDETEDLKRDLNGRLLSDSAKQKKYSETEEYRRNSLIQQEKRNRRVSKGENFTSIKLRSTSDAISPKSDTLSSSPLHSPSMSPLNRRGSTGSFLSTPSTSPKNPNTANAGVDHFLKVKLKSTASSRHFYNTNETSPINSDTDAGPGASNITVTTTCDDTSSSLSSPVSGPEATVNHMYLASPLAKKSKYECTLDEEENNSNAPAHNLPKVLTAEKVTTVSVGKTVAANRESDNEPLLIGMKKEEHLACAVDTVKVVSGGYKTLPSSNDKNGDSVRKVDNTSSVTDNVHLPSSISSMPMRTESRRVSTGSYFASKSFTPPGGAKHEDFRQVKLKSSQQSKYQLLEQSTAHGTDSYDNDLGNSKKSSNVEVELAFSGKSASSPDISSKEDFRQVKLKPSKPSKYQELEQNGDCIADACIVDPENAEQSKNGKSDEAGLSENTGDIEILVEPGIQYTTAPMGDSACNIKEDTHVDSPPPTGCCSLM